MQVNDLIVNNLRFAKYIVAKYTPRNLITDDHISAGYLGLVIAANKYDPNKGDFFSFAKWQIRGELARLNRLLNRAKREPKENVFLHEINNKVRKRYEPRNFLAIPVPKNGSSKEQCKEHISKCIDDSCMNNVNGIYFIYHTKCKNCKAKLSEKKQKARQEFCSKSCSSSYRQKQCRKNASNVK